MNETFKNLLQQNRAKKVYEKKEQEKRHYQVWLSMKKYLRRSYRQVHHGNARIWPNHRTMRAAMKKKLIVLPAKFARSLG